MATFGAAAGVDADVMAAVDAWAEVADEVFVEVAMGAAVAAQA